MLLNSRSRRLARNIDRLVDDAVRNVPFYAARSGAQIGGAQTHFPRWQSLPPITKSELVSEPRQRLIHPAFDSATLGTETTTGSSGQPFTLALDRGYVVRRNLRFLRALLDVGYRLGHRLMLVSSAQASGTASRLGWHYQSLAQSPETLLEAYERIRPHVLYGCTTPLRLLAERARWLRVALPRPKLLIGTGELLSPGTRTLLQETFGAPVADFYGCTEMGLVAWRGPDAPYYKTFDESVVIELLAHERLPGWHELILTNLELRAMPMLRLKVGDLAEVAPVNGVQRIVGFRGREVDVLWRDDQPVSPYAITGEFETIPGLARFQLTQRAMNHFDVTLECDADYEFTVQRRVQSILQRAFGEHVDISTNVVDRIPVHGLRKFQPVRSLVSQ